MREAFSCGTLRGLEEAGENRCCLLPIASFLLKLLTTEPGEFVEFGLTIVVGDAPFGCDPSLLLQLQQSGIQGSIIEREQVSTGLFNAASNAITVLRSHGFNGLQDHECQ